MTVKFGFEEGGENHNSEGRLITAEFESFYLVTTYVPNAGRGDNQILLFSLDECPCRFGHSGQEDGVGSNVQEACGES